VAVVVGIGLNVAWPIGWPPPEIAPELSRATTLERAAGRAVDRDALAAGLLAAVRRRYAGLAAPAGRLQVVEDYRRACSTIGRDVRVDLVRGQLFGRALDVRSDGRLVVECQGARQVVLDAGDVVHLR
jgi:BirA family biotin operon repressor/biotin-[acetyl-CoA-carboxylase] ligase